MSFRHGVLFAVLAAVWGSSFLWIGIALDGGISPMTLATLRVGLGLAGLLAVACVKRITWPHSPRLWLIFFLVGVFNFAIPFPLISWAETRISTGMASVLNSTVPLFTNLFAHVLFHDERMSPRRVFGLLWGFGGVVVLAGNALTGGAESSAMLPGILAMLGAVISYSVTNCLAKKFLRGQPPIVTTTCSLLFALALMLPTLLLTESPVRWPHLAVTWGALGWLGFLGLAWAYVAYFELIEHLGPSRVSTVAYLFPFVGMTLGVAFRGESLSWRLLAGAVMIVAGLWIVNRPISSKAEEAVRAVQD